MEWLLIVGTACMVPVVLVLVALTTPAQNFLWGRKLAASAGAKNPYRGRQDVRATDLHEPWTVRLAATLSALLGGMIVPGGLAALAALIPLFGVGGEIIEGRTIGPEAWTVFLVALSAPSGMAIAYRSLRIFSPMLRNEENITPKMRGLAWHSGVHNALLLGLYAWAAMVIRENDLSWLMVSGYNVISLIHVAFLFVAARSIDRRRAENAAYEASATRVGGAFIEPPSWSNGNYPDEEALAEEEAARALQSQALR